MINACTQRLNERCRHPTFDTLQLRRRPQGRKHMPAEVMLKTRFRHNSEGNTVELVRARGHLDEVQEMRKGGSTLMVRQRLVWKTAVSVKLCICSSLNSAVVRWLGRQRADGERLKKVDSAVCASWQLAALRLFCGEELLHGGV